MDYPPNSRKAHEAPLEEKKVERVATATRRKKSLGKQFKETFIAGDSKAVVQYVFFGVIIPAAKDMIVDAGKEGIERLVMGETRRHRPGSRPGSPGPRISYNRMYSGSEAPAPMQQRTISRRARSQHDFDEIVLNSRTEAEEVLDRLFDLISRYEAASVADLYELTGLDSKHTDHKWGWTELRGANVARVRSGGYLLDLPAPEPLD